MHSQLDVATLRPYLEASRFTIRTEHNAPRWPFNINEASTRLARWILWLAKFDYEARYRPGFEHQSADALSQIITNGSDQVLLDDGFPTLWEGLQSGHHDPDDDDLLRQMIIPQGYGKPPQVLM